MPMEAYGDPGALKRALVANRQLAGQDLERWRFRVAFRSPRGAVPFVAFEPGPR